MVGYNLEGSEIGAAFGLEQLKKLSHNIQIRNKNFIRQQEFFSKHSNYFSIPKELPNSKTAWLAYPLLIKENAPFSRRDFQIYLEKNQIQTRVVFTGNILRQPMCQGINKKINKNGYPNSDNVMKNGVLLPLHHGLSNSMFIRLHKTIEDFLEMNNC